ncbi:hypothetical protein TWF281_004490 [Arthrobotrys megalospora]
MQTSDPQEHFELPETPQKLTTRLPYLTFRVPGTKISERRGREIIEEICRQERLMGSLEEGLERLREQCREELNAVDYNTPLGGSRLFDKFQGHLKDVAEGLGLAISPKLDLVTTKRDTLQKQLKRIKEGLEWDSRDIERYNLDIRDLNQAADKVQKNIDKLKADMRMTAAEVEVVLQKAADEKARRAIEIWGTNESEGGFKRKIRRMLERTEREEETKEEDVENEDEDRERGERENNEEEKEEGDEYEDRDEDEDEDGKHKGDAGEKGGVDEERGAEMEEGQKTGEMETPIQERNAYQQLLQGQELLGEDERKRDTDTKKPRKGKLRIQTIEEKPRNQKESLSRQKMSQYEADRDKIQERIQEVKDNLARTYQGKSELENERKRVLKELKGLENLDISKSEEAEEERERDKERKEELERQYKRKQNLESLRKYLGFRRYHLSDRYPMYETGRYSKIQGEGELIEVEEILRKVERLEEIFIEVFKSKQRLKEVQDLIAVLNRERFIEGKISQPLKRPQDPASELQKGHLFTSRLEYKPLEEGHIRLLILWHAPADHYPLICSLKNRPLEANLSREHQYAALSYFWGVDPPAACLYLLHDDDRRVRPNKDNWGSIARHAKRVIIRNNLFRALLRLRRSDKPVALWVDYLCINQEDTVEKTAQLREMVKIYRMAEKVCIWLGEADDAGRSDMAMNFIETVKDFAMLDTYAEDKKRAEEWHGLSELMRDRWFSRRWVVQEIALAKTATVHCGSKSVPWSDFVDAVSILVSNQVRIRSLFDPKVWREGPGTLGEVQSFGANILITEMNSLFWRAEDGTIIKPVKSLESLVTTLKTFDTSDQRDLIYSLIFIAYDTYQHPGGYKPELIDYRKTVAEVYKDFISFCVNSPKSNAGYPLDIICRPWAMPVKNKTRKSEPQLPSWIALLSDSVFGEPELVYKGRKNGETFVGSAGQARYRASGDKECLARFDPVEEGDLDRSLYSLNGDHTINGDRPVNGDYEINGSHETDGDPAMNEENCVAETPDESAKYSISRAFPWALVVKGFKLAEIKKVSPKNTGGLILQESLAMGGWPGIEHSPDDVPDKIWRTLVANKDSRDQIPPTWYQRACLRCLEIADNFNGGDLNVGQLLQGGTGMMYTYLTRVRNTIWNRSFFTAKITRRPDANLSRADTFDEFDDIDEDGAPSDIPQNLKRKKSYFDIRDVYGNNEKEDNDDLASTELFGLCPGDTRSEDFVCIIYGCSVPVVLRLTAPGPLQQRFSLIGEAYVHGKMDGEAIDSYQAGWALGVEEEFNLM